MDTDPDKQRPRRRLLVITVFAVVLVAGGVWAFQQLFPSHPRFGAILETAAFDLNEARSNRVGLFLRKHLPSRVVQSPHFPSRFKDQPRYLDLKGTSLEWSIGGTNTGWLYFWGVGQGSAITDWEFAPCPETNFLEVTDVPKNFYGSSDPGRTEAFGSRSSTNAINVAVGQVLFARRTKERKMVYVLKLKEQQGNKLVVDYCVVTP